MIIRQEPQQKSQNSHNSQENNPGLYPPCINKGGKSRKSAFTAIVDYLSFTFKPEIDDEYYQVRFGSKEHQSYSFGSHGRHLSGVLACLAKIIPGLTYHLTDRGYSGYEHTFRLYRGGKSCGLAAYGGKGQNGSVLVSLTGAGCALVDMQKIHDFISELPHIKITRVDLAHDDFAGKYSYNFWKNAAESGKFAGLGRPPVFRLIENSDEGKGNTVYVGSKQSGKEACCYEKGKQMGNPKSKHTRIEGRLYAIDREIPLEVLLKPAEYLAGMYPIFAIFSEIYEKIKVVKEYATTSAAVLVHHARRSYGKMVNYLLTIGHSTDEIVGLLLKPGIPARLESAHVLMGGIQA